MPNATDQLTDLVDTLSELLNDTATQPAKLIDLRMEDRPERTLPVLVIPCRDGQPQVDKTSFAVTRNLSPTGAALLSQTAVVADEIILGLWNDKRCCFAQGTVRYRQQIEAGFSQIGVELTRLVHPSQCAALQRIANLASRLTSPTL